MNVLIPNSQSLLKLDNKLVVPRTVKLNCEFGLVGLFLHDTGWEKASRVNTTPTDCQNDQLFP